MTEEQKKRIGHVEPGECCDFDGLPMHPHYYYYLTFFYLLVQIR